MAQFSLNGFSVNAAGDMTANKVTSNGPTVLRRTPQTVAYQILATDRLVGYTQLAAARIATLPPVASVAVGHLVSLKDEVGNAGTNNLTLKGSGSETIDGSNTAVISANYGAITVYSTGAGWAKLS